jgi:hypothetical protein
MSKAETMAFHTMRRRIMKAFDANGGELSTLEAAKIMWPGLDNYGPEHLVAANNFMKTIDEYLVITEQLKQRKAATVARRKQQSLVAEYRSHYATRRAK